MPSLSVVIAPDSFKGSLMAAEVANAIAKGWQSVRTGDQIQVLPLADGGEGTLDAVVAANPDAVEHWLEEVTGPDGRPVRGCWIELPDGTAVVELAQPSGIPLMAELDPMNATTLGLGQVIADALDHGATRIICGLGGSASTDGGVGALSALGLEFLDAEGQPIGPGGGALARLASIRGEVRKPAELILLTDVTIGLLGERGAAAIFGPQKGANPAQVAELDRNLAQLAEILGGPTDVPGMGAAGGVGYGLGVALGGRMVQGAPYLSKLSGLDAALPSADLLISGEGRFDHTSLRGKVVGHVMGLAEQSGVRRAVIAGQVATEVDGVWTQSLIELAGSVDEAMANTERWLVEAGAAAARSLG